MFIFLVDCWVMGIALLLALTLTRYVLKKQLAMTEFWVVSLGYGFCIFILARFVMSLVIVWGLWE